MERIRSHTAAIDGEGVDRTSSEEAVVKRQVPEVEERIDMDVAEARMLEWARSWLSCSLLLSALLAPVSSVPPPVVEVAATLLHPLPQVATPLC